MKTKEIHIAIVGSALIFLLASLAFVTQGAGMIVDSDTFWHIAAGDWIRKYHMLPKTDPWSFTAGDYSWLNISWAWDIWVSQIKNEFGWYGAEAFNAVTLGLTMALVYAACFVSCKDGIAAFFATFCVLCMVSPALRSLQVSNVMMALWVLLLNLAARGELRLRWLVLLPLTMVAWVNMHGSFFTGFILLAVFALDAFLERDMHLLKPLLLAGLASVLAALLNPYGVDILEATRRTLGSSTTSVLGEWRAFSFSAGDLLGYFYMPVFALLVFRKSVPVTRPLRWVSYLWLFLALTSVRSVGVFAIVSAPMVACRFKVLMKPKQAPSASAMAIRKKAETIFSNPATAVVAMFLSMAFAAWLPTPAASRLLDVSQAGIVTLAPEEDFIKARYPHAHILTHYDLGGILAYETQGAVPIFTDGRSETAFPAQVMQDYFAFEYASKDWEKIFDRYKINGVLIPKGNAKNIMPRRQLLDRFTHRVGWRMAFDGPSAVLFIRER